MSVLYAGVSIAKYSSATLNTGLYLELLVSVFVDVLHEDARERVGERSGMLEPGQERARRSEALYDAVTAAIVAAANSAAPEG